MAPDPTLMPGRDALGLLAAMVAILAVASVTGLSLKWRRARHRPHAVIDNLNARIRAWWVIVAVTGLGLLAGRGGVCLLFALASAQALREFAPQAEPTRAGALLRAGAFAVTALQYLLLGAGVGGLALLAVPLYVLVLVLAVAATVAPRQTALELGSGLVLGVWCIGHIPALYLLDGPGLAERGGFLVAWLLMVSQASDVLQYIWGKLAGRRLLAARISPSKTLEGALGGVASATALGAGLAWMTPFGSVTAAALALLLCILGVLGGLLLSALKRRRGIKDWSSLISGHGGMLDRLDSLCLAAPAFYWLLRAA